MTGELAAITSAILWAITSVIYGRVGQRVSPLELNFVKGVIAIALLALTITLQAQWGQSFPLGPVLLLGLSGAIGIGLGDTAFFLSLQALGPRQALVLETLAPALAALLAWIFLAETLNLLAWGGIFLTMVGVAWVTTERNTTPTPSPTSQRYFFGIVWGLLAALGQAMGAVLSRFALTNSEIPSLWSAAFRLVAGVVVVLGLMVVSQGKQGLELKILRSRRLILTVFVTAFLGTYLAIWLQQTSLKFAATGIAQTLTSTSPLFVIPLTLMLGESVSLRAIFGVLVALAGVSLLFLGR